MIRKAGQLISQLISKPGFRDYATNVGIEAGAQVAAEQLLPRVLGQQPEASLAESVLRQGTSAAVGVPVQKGMQKLGLPQAVSYVGSQLIAQPTGQFVTQALLPGNQSYPLAIDPEPAEAGHANYGQLMAEQQIQAANEKMKYDNMVRLAMARNYNPPSFVRHSSSGSAPQDAVNEMLRMAKTSYMP